MDANELLKDLAEEAGLDTEDKTPEEIAAEVADMTEEAKKESEETPEGETAPSEATILDALATVAKEAASEDTEEDQDEEEE